MVRAADEPWRTRLQAYSRTVTLRTVYGDIDSFQHLNNIALARFFEEGRAALNMEVFGVDMVVRPSGGAQLLFARVSIDYLAQGRYPGEVTVATAVSRVGSSSFSYAAALFQDDACIALSDAVTVFAMNDASQPLPENVRAALLALQPRI